ncbi:hypothetical protein RFI_16854 [Reticulomyxa filosa]|uniref:Uncharacterized protein n=1 Tax=Reticulomyxa filosa TaxID=46433 RepID=X6N3C4_RETFI|nr:hypothetical protein RFI_16854 [Reticulomyxa filosa]|eukprot:ETO20363.1 hypothetical protein RFI_16854 [Reticulomyxa filosa]
MVSNGNRKLKEFFVLLFFDSAIVVKGFLDADLLILFYNDQLDCSVYNNLCASNMDILAINTALLVILSKYKKSNVQVVVHKKRTNFANIISFDMMSSKALSGNSGNIPSNNNTNTFLTSNPTLGLNTILKLGGVLFNYCETEFLFFKKYFNEANVRKFFFMKKKGYSWKFDSPREGYRLPKARRPISNWIGCRVRFGEVLFGIAETGSQVQFSLFVLFFKKKNTVFFAKGEICYKKKKKKKSVSKLSTLVDDMKGVVLYDNDEKGTKLNVEPMPIGDEEVRGRNKSPSTTRASNATSPKTTFFRKSIEINKYMNHQNNNNNNNWQ